MTATDSSTPPDYFAKLLALEPAAQEMLFTAARTANRFADEPVTDEQLRAIWELAKWPPTSANTNPMRVLYLRTPEARERLLPHLAEGNRAKSASAPVTAVLAYDPQYTEHLPQLLPFRPDFKEILEADPVKHQEQARFNAALQAGYFSHAGQGPARSVAPGVRRAGPAAAHLHAGTMTTPDCRVQARPLTSAA